MRSVLLCVLFAGSVWTSLPCSAATIGSTQLCWKGDGSPNLFEFCSVTTGADNFEIGTLNPGSAVQVFDGSATATGTDDTWKVAVSLNLANYRRDMYVWTPSGGGGSSIATTGMAETRASDSITVGGQNGFYSLHYIFSLDGTLSTTDPALFTPTFCTSVLLPQGVAANPAACASPGQTVPSTIDLSYDGLPFGLPIDPTIDIQATGLVTPIFAADIPSIGGSVMSGGLTVNFADTVHLQSLLVTDANGNPIRGVSIFSQEGITYPLDPRNSAVPEPAWLSPAGLLALAVFRRFRS
jgi:hypothetical protein